MSKPRKCDNCGACDKHDPCDCCGMCRNCDQQHVGSWVGPVPSVFPYPVPVLYPDAYPYPHGPHWHYTGTTTDGSFTLTDPITVTANLAEATTSEVVYGPGCIPPQTSYTHN